MSRFAALFLSLLLVVVPLAQQPAGDPPLQAELLSHSQAMLDAVASGNTDVWAEYVAEDALLTWDDGLTISKAEMLQELRPLPAGYVGQIRIENPQMRRAGDAIVLSYDCLEHLSVFDQKVADQRYHATETWAKHNRSWRIVALQVTRLYLDPPVGTIDPARITDYVGTYTLGPMSYTATVEAGALVGQRSGRNKETLLPATPDVFFRKGAAPAHKFFERDASGRVVRLRDRKNGSELVWTRE
jgi:hypothetical protein